MAYAFYQFWLNVTDADVYKFLSYFTFLPVADIAAIESSDKNSAGKPEAQGILAREVTQMVHGEEGLTAATRISQALFSGDISSLSRSDLEQLALDGLPCTTLSGPGGNIVEVLVSTGLARSNRAAREFIGSNAISANGESVVSVDFQLDAAQALEGQYFVLKRGKKQFHLVKLPA